jgi:phage gp45-like
MVVLSPVLSLSVSLLMAIVGTFAGTISVASDKFSDAAGNINVDGADVNNSVFLTIDTKAPNAVDLNSATDVQSTSKALFTRSEIAVGVAFDTDIANTTDTRQEY